MLHANILHLSQGLFVFVLKSEVCPAPSCRVLLFVFYGILLFRLDVAFDTIFSSLIIYNFASFDVIIIVYFKNVSYVCWCLMCAVVTKVCISR